MLGDNWIKAIHPDDRDAMAQRWLEMIDPRKDVIAEFRFQTPAGVTTWVHGKVATLYDENGEVSGYVGAEMDITERHRMEEEMRLLNEQLELHVADRTRQLEHAVAELKQADQLKDTFLATVSHELRTPLTGVLGMADALEMQVGGALGERQLRYVQQIRQSGERLLKMVNSILHYSALLAGKVQVQPEPCRLVELCAISLRGVRERATQKRLKLQFAVLPDDLQLISDANGILQTLENLLDNAVKFTPEGGTVGLEALLDPSENAVHLTVWDTGIGIAPKDQATIFKPFEQIDRGLDRQYEGVGLGLDYAGQMVRILGGTIAVQSEPGCGSRFTVTLPREPVAGS
ncbi:MAG: PAS domain-containing sensor histidine kinase [Anaerolineales bacterium]|nr:PAS domain-containing sensor histidine kinase [Anaerolineales bacterium]